jgi:hypothetical protein
VPKSGCVGKHFDGLPNKALSQEEYYQYLSIFVDNKMTVVIPVFSDD